jgi:subtilisin
MPKIEESDTGKTGISRREILRGSIAAGTGGFVLSAGGGSTSASSNDEYNVGTESPAAEKATKQAAENIERVFDWDDGKKTFTGQFTEEAVKGLEKRPNVRYVELNGTMHAIAQTLPWGIDRVDAEKVHADGETGGDNTDGEGGADIAIIDTGIDDDHPDLQTNVGAGKAYVDCKGSNCNYPWSDDNDHGTHCAGIADAIDNSEGVIGVSTDATLHAVKVLDKRGSGSFSDVAAGIQYTADQGWDVGSMSLGASSGSSTVKDACQYATDEGVLLVAAAGNDGACSDCVGYPAAYSTVIAVSSTDSDDNLSSFSSTGPEVELAAPGGDIYSTVIGGYDTFSGTSMACPHVAGAGGQLMDNGYTNTKARDQLNSTAEDIGLNSNEQGNGLLDVAAAVSGSTDSAPSVSWVNPSDGETVSGTITIQIDASDSEDSDDSLDVAYNVDSESSRSASYNTTSGYYEDSLDTTQFSDTDHTFEANATDSTGNTSSSTITVTTENTESSPTVDSLSASEVETGDDDAEFDVDWTVSDNDSDLDSVDLTLTDDTGGETDDTATVSVSGDSGSGTTRLVAAGDDGSGNTYTVEAVVTDSNGNTGSDTTTVSETEDTSSAPVIDTFELTNDSNPAWTRYYVDWTVSDDDGDLGSVTSEMIDSDGNVLDSGSSSVSGSSASGTHYVETKGSASKIRLTVTDRADNSTSDSTPI